VLGNPRIGLQAITKTLKSVYFVQNKKEFILEKMLFESTTFWSETESIAYRELNCLCKKCIGAIIHATASDLLDEIDTVF
jgi:hypothetical protein